MGAMGLQATPGWAVGWFFIPIMNLWKPYQAMCDLWRASSEPKNWNGVERGSILPVWWALWLLSGALSNGSFKLSLKAETFDQLRLASMVTLLSDLATIPSLLIAYVLVSQITGLQARQVSL